MNNSKYKVFSIDDTEHWNLPDLPDTSRILSVYLYDSTKGTHCCEITLSYECHKLYSVLVDENLDDTEYESLIDMIVENDNVGDVIYLHCGNVDALETIDVEGDFDSIEEAIEEANCNCLI